MTKCTNAAKGHLYTGVPSASKTCPTKPASPGQFTTDHLISKDCLPGSYSGVGANRCTLCNTGQYQDVSRKTECKKCSAGQYSFKQGAAECQHCDEDSDLICGFDDTCILDAENDADSDGVCGNVDECIYDAENDVDSDSICGDIDSCAYDSENDADSDTMCAMHCTRPDCTMDECPYDTENDADSDNICGDVDSCEYDAENDADSDALCGDFDSCEYDVENDADSDVLCADVDTCDYDAENDADSDLICGDKDSCPYDATNDKDGNKVCQNFDNCYPNPCKNGVCTNAKSDSLAGGYTCKCDSGWQGTLCDKDIDDCASKPCVHGVCSDAGPDKYSCACKQYWSGKKCQFFQCCDAQKISLQDLGDCDCLDTSDSPGGHKIFEIKDSKIFGKDGLDVPFLQGRVTFKVTSPTPLSVTSRLKVTGSVTYTGNIDKMKISAPSIENLNLMGLTGKSVAVDVIGTSFDVLTVSDVSSELEVAFDNVNVLKKATFSSIPHLADMSLRNSKFEGALNIDSATDVGNVEFVVRFMLFTQVLYCMP